MKTLGLIGGLSWVSTVEYYTLINQLISRRLGGLNSARIILHSVNFEEFRPPLDPRDWGSLTDSFCAIAQNLERSGADGLVLCANTPHLVADAVQAAISIPLIHIAEATGKEIVKQGIDKVGLLGTRVTMEQDFYKGKLSKQQIETIIPEPEDRAFIHASVFDEMAKGIFSPATKARYIKIINDLVARGARGMILGCTEIPLLIKPEDVSIPVFDTTVLHATAAVDFALSE